MAKGTRYSRSTPAPHNASEAAPHLRRFMIKLYDRKDGMAADWGLIAETLFREAFATLDLAAGDPRVQGILHRAQSGAYDRLTAGPVSDTAFPPAPFSPAAPAEARPAPDPAFKGR